MKAIIFNSGIGNRMGELTKNNPKCMLQLYNGEKIFERQIRILGECGIKEFVITTGPFESQLIDVAEKFQDFKFTFVHNREYDKTNYIVSMDNAYNYIDDDFLLLHGDLVFNKNLIKKVISSEYPSVCLYNKEKSSQHKDFKGRFKNNYLQEVSVDIFGDNCFAFQPLYKLDKDTICKWKDKVREFVNQGFVNVYAENALNEIADDLKICGLSYKDDYIDEIDNLDDYLRVSEEIRYFDYREQEIVETTDFKTSLQKVLSRRKTDNIFVVSGNTYKNHIEDILREFGYKLYIFYEFTPNPSYDEIKRGVEVFKRSNYDTIIAIGGGSAIDVAKCIKLFYGVENERDIFSSKFSYNNINFIAVPTTGGTGSESTGFAVMYYNDEKISVAHDSIIPSTVILNSSFLKTVSDYQKKSTFLDALCQSIESYWSKGTTDESRVYVEKSLKLLKENYRGYLENDDKSLRNIMTASNLSGKAINISKTTAPHAMSYKLTSLYKIGHGHAVALTLPYVWRLIYEKGDTNIRELLFDLAQIIGCKTVEDSIDWFISLIKEFNFKKIEMKESDIDVLVDSVNMERLNNTPVTLSKTEIKEIYELLRVS